MCHALWIMLIILQFMTGISIKVKIKSNNKTIQYEHPSLFFPFPQPSYPVYTWLGLKRWVFVELQHNLRNWPMMLLAFMPVQVRCLCYLPYIGVPVFSMWCRQQKHKMLGLIPSWVQLFHSFFLSPSILFYFFFVQTWK